MHFTRPLAAQGRCEAATPGSGGQEGSAASGAVRAGRRVAGDTRLGSLGRTANTVVPLTAVRMGGGALPRTVLVVLRRHQPLLHHRRAPAPPVGSIQAAAKSVPLVALRLSPSMPCASLRAGYTADIKLHAIAKVAAEPQPSPRAGKMASGVN